MLNAELQESVFNTELRCGREAPLSCTSHTFALLKLELLNKHLIAKETGKVFVHLCPCVCVRLDDKEEPVKPCSQQKTFVLLRLELLKKRLIEKQTEKVCVRVCVCMRVLVCVCTSVDVFVCVYVFACALMTRKSR